LNLGEGLFKGVNVVIPTGTFDLETENVGTVLRVSWKVWLPVHLLEDFGLDVSLVELDLVFSREDLLDGGHEGVGVEQPVNERYLGDLGGVILPDTELLDSLLDIVQPGSETTHRWEGKLLPSCWHLVEVDVLHQIFHLF